jgi:hypothetical protein
MNDIIKELEAHFTFRLVEKFRNLIKKVIPGPYPIPILKEFNMIARKKFWKTG